MATKVNISRKLTAAEIMNQYGVSRATAYLGRKRGYIVLNYHTVEKNISSLEAISEPFTKVYSEFISILTDEEMAKFMEIAYLKSGYIEGMENPSGYLATIARNLMKKRKKL